MRNKKTTVTIGLSAYNEEANIGNLLQSILSQKEDGFTLKKILVVSDGSTDNTVNILRSFKNSKVKVINSKVRLGQPTRLNQIYSLFNSDYLIQTDADAIFSHKNVIKYVVEAFSRNRRVAMIGGDVTPIKPKNLVQKAIFASNAFYKALGEEINKGNNIFTVNGPFLAYRHDFVKAIRLPKDIIASDKFMYLKCIMLGHKYKFSKNSGVFFELPLTLRDQVKQNSRFKVAKKLLTQYFPVEVLQREYRLPRKLILKRLLIQFVKAPLPLFYIFLINRYCKILAFYKEKKMSNILWDKLERTKVVLNH